MDINQQVLNLPIVTKYLIIVNVVVYLIIFITSFNINLLSINSYNIIYNYEIYRIVSASFIHGGPMHIVMNMMSLYQLGVDLESQFGSLSMIFITIWTIFLSGILYALLQWFLAIITRQSSFLGISAVGYSCVLFTYAVIEAFHTNQPTRSVFGFFNVPSKIYPFILLIILQVMLPNISFIGHLSGVIVGLLIITGIIDYLIPSLEGLQYIESNYLTNISRSSNYIRCTNKSYINSATNTVVQSISNAGKYILSISHNIITTLLYIVGCPFNRIKSYIDVLFTNIYNYLCCCKCFRSPPTVEPFQGPARTIVSSNRLYQQVRSNDFEEGVEVVDNSKNKNENSEIV